jgi:TolB-like protein/tetratricopeptide (TPR) repeat protein
MKRPVPPPSASPLLAADDRTFRFGNVTLDLGHGSLRDAKGVIELRSKSFEVLCYLVVNAGRLVAKDELLQAMWPNVTVSDESLTRCISDVRRALQDRDSQIIKTVPRRGYRFEASVSVSGRPVANGISNVGAKLPSAEGPSIAVLPFENISAEPEQDYFADGLAEEVTIALSRFKWLFVISRNSSFVYKRKIIDAKQVGRELGVRYVLQGSVRKMGSHIRISGQLIEAATGAHLWANTFDGGLQDIFELQVNVTRSVVGAIAPRLIKAEIEFAKRKPAATWDSYDRYFRGVAMVHQFTPDALSNAAEEFRLAIALDPDFALAHARLAACSVARKFLYGQAISEVERSDALRHAARAVELGPEDETALAYCGFVFAFLDDECERASVLAERAIELNPNVSLAWTVLGWAQAWLGEPERARTAFDHAIRLNPLDKPALIQILPGYIVICFVSGRHEERLAWANHLLALDPNNLTGLLAALDVAHLQGRSADTAGMLARIRATYPDLRASQVKQIFMRYRKPEHRAKFDEFMQRLEIAD